MSLTKRQRLNSAIATLREYCDGGTSCEACIIKEKIHCSYTETPYVTNCPSPFSWSEYNGEPTLDLIGDSL